MVTWIEPKDDLEALLNELPPMAQVATKAMALTDDQSKSSKDLQVVIQLDAGLSARILSVANCPLFSGIVPSTTLSHAVTRLGMTRLKRIIMIASLGQMFDPGEQELSAMWEHALAVATASLWFSQNLAMGAPEECFIAGLLHDIGKVVLYRRDPEGYGEHLRQAAEKQVRSFRYERKLSDELCHTAIGTRIADVWNLGEVTLHPIRDHHRIEIDPWALQESLPSTIIVCLANLVVHALGLDGAEPMQIDPLQSKPAVGVGVKQDMLDQCAEELPEQIQEHRSALS